MTDTNPGQADWQPGASLDALRQRARLLQRVRAWFAEQGVLEVETPLLSAATGSDPQLDSFTLRYHGPGPRHGQLHYLQTSPEFHMKRLLAAGSGSIFQLGKAFRDGEYGARHNPEFTLLEWYRVGYDHLDLMEDMERMLQTVLDGILPVSPVSHWRYRDLFIEFAGIDPVTAAPREMQSVLERHAIGVAGMGAADIEAWSDLVMTHVIEPRLGDGLLFVRDYPPGQAALARLRDGNPPVASRFEVYLNGLELANGFHELQDAAEQRRRFLQDNHRRRAQGRPSVAADERLLAALAAGLPDCAGVALGFDRLVMLACGAASLDAVISFGFSRA